MKIVQLMLALVLVAVFLVVDGRKIYKFDRTRRLDLDSDSSEHRPSYVLPVRDLETAATHHGHHGRVQIKVYRGPDDGHHAPHGYWVKQPADDYGHH